MVGKVRLHAPGSVRSTPANHSRHEDRLLSGCIAGCCQHLVTSLLLSSCRPPSPPGSIWLCCALHGMLCMLLPDDTCMPSRLGSDAAGAHGATHVWHQSFKQTNRTQARLCVSGTGWVQMVGTRLQLSHHEIIVAISMRSFDTQICHSNFTSLYKQGPQQYIGRCTPSQPHSPVSSSHFDRSPGLTLCTILS